MDNRVNKSRKRHSGVQGPKGPMLKKVLKTMPYFKENIPEQLNNYSAFTNGLKKVLGLYLLYDSFT